MDDEERFFKAVIKTTEDITEQYHRWLASHATDHARANSYRDLKVQALRELCANLGYFYDDIIREAQDAQEADE